MKVSRLVGAVPINRTAALVTGKGEGHDVTVKDGGPRRWQAPPRCREVPKGTPDMRGVRFGRFCVVGYLGSNPKRGTEWLCRCACGDYEPRRGKSVRNQENSRDCCHRCRRLEYVKKMG